MEKGLIDQYAFNFLHDSDDWRCCVVLSSPLQGALFAGYGMSLDASLLGRLVSLVPHLRTLVIPQLNLHFGPYTRDLVLPNLTTLRITLMAPNELTFYKYHTHFSISSLRWLDPEVMYKRFPGLRRLEVYTPNGRWEADLVTEKLGKGPPLKLVESLTTTTMRHEAPMEWDLMSLERPIFDPSKFHKLKFGGPWLDCRWGSGLRTLSLDWECHNTDEDIESHTTQEVYFGPAARITNLDGLSSLTHLTISLQALFGDADTFEQWAQEMETNVEAEITKLLPPSLRTLRIAEYVPGLHEAGWILLGTGNDAAADFDGEDIRLPCLYVQNLLQALSIHWLLRAEGRELWFRRYALLDCLAAETGRGMGRAGLDLILDCRSMGDDGFEQVIRPAQDITWEPWDDILEADFGWDPAEPLVLDPPVDSDSLNWNGPGLEETTEQLEEENFEQPDEGQAEQLETD